MKHLVASLTLGLFLTGCLVPNQSYQPVNHYDLTTDAELRPLPLNVGASVEIGRFDTVGPYGRRMVYRKGRHRLVQDEYNRWIEPPDQLTRHAFYRMLANSNAFKSVSMPPAPDADLRLEGTILRWETDPELNAVIELNIRLLILGPDKLIMSKHYTQTEKLDEAGPTHFAEAASAAMMQIIQHAASEAVRAYAEHEEALTRSGE